MNTDTRMMRLADAKAEVQGLYYGKPYKGIAIKSRQHTCSFREEVTVTVSEPVERPGRFMSSENLIISAQKVDRGEMTIEAI